MERSFAEPHPEQEEYEDDQVNPIILPYTTIAEYLESIDQLGHNHPPTQNIEIPPYCITSGGNSTAYQSPENKSCDHGEGVTPQDGTAITESDIYNDFITTVRRVMAEAPHDDRQEDQEGSATEDDEDTYYETDEDDDETDSTASHAPAARLAHLLRFYDDTLLLPQDSDTDEESGESESSYSLDSDSEGTPSENEGCDEGSDLSTSGLPHLEPDGASPWEGQDEDNRSCSSTEPPALVPASEYDSSEDDYQETYSSSEEDYSSDESEDDYSSDWWMTDEADTFTPHDHRFQPTLLKGGAGIGGTSRAVKHFSELGHSTMLSLGPGTQEASTVSYTTQNAGSEGRAPCVPISNFEPGSTVLLHKHPLLLDVDGHPRVGGDHISQSPSTPTTLPAQDTAPVFYHPTHVFELSWDTTERTWASSTVQQEAEMPDAVRRRGEAENNPVYAYKKVANKVRPVPATLPEEFRIVRYPHPDPLDGLPVLPTHPPPFSPTERFTQERREAMDLDPEGFLTEQEIRLCEWLIGHHPKVFAFDETEKGSFKEEYFPPVLIPTIEHTPWVFKNIPIPNGIYDEVVKIIKSKIDSGIYEPSSSSYRSRWFCVVKKDGKSLRLVHDLQPLNGVSIRDPAVPPFMDQMSEKAAGRACYSTLDLFVAFDQRKLDIRSRDMTTFQTPLGTFRLTAIPMGYTNSFQIMHNDVVFILQDEMPNIASPYADDVLVSGPKTRYELPDGTYETIPENPGIRRFIWEHLQDLNRVLQRFGAYGATVSGKKVFIAQPYGIFVGNKCTYDGRIPDESKIQRVVDWPRCENVHDVRGFLGTVGVLRIFIKDFAFIARPLVNLTRKNVEFYFDEECDSSMDQLKVAVSTSPALRPIDYESGRPVILAVDSSNKGYGYILYQLGADNKRYPNRFGSATWNATQSNYSQPKVELFGLYCALRATRQYIVNVPKLIVEVDAKYIKGMINNPDLQPNATINRWIAGILLFDFELVHVPASKHQGPDGLSRRRQAPQDEEDTESDQEEWLDRSYSFLLRNAECLALSDSAMYAQESLREESQATEAVLTDEFPVSDSTALRNKRLHLVQSFLKRPVRPDGQSDADFTAFVKYASNFFLKGDRLWRKRPDGRHQLVPVPEKRIGLIKHIHDDLGHKGVYSVRIRALDRFWWPSLELDIKWYIKTCHECQIRSFQQLRMPPTVATPAPLFRKVYIDTMLLPKSKGKRYLVQARDSLSGWPEWRALRSESAQSIADFIYEDILCRWGAIEDLVTDNGSAYVAAGNLLAEKYGFNHIRISPYNSQANGIVERRHRDVREALMKMSENGESHWSEVVNAVFWAERITVSRATGYSPYFLAHGVEPLHPFDLVEATYMTAPFGDPMTSAQLLETRAIQLLKRPGDLERAKELVLKARFASAKAFEEAFQNSIKAYEFQPGDLVLARNTKINLELNRKSKPKYLGPFVIVRRTKGGAYILAELDGSISKTRYAAFHIIPYHARKTLSVSLTDLTGLDESELEQLGRDENPPEDTEDE